MSVKTKEFADLMHHTLATRIPVLSLQIHRPLDPANESPPDGGDMSWNWPAAEARLKEAFDQGGLSRWIETALREVEAEARVERLKREAFHENRGTAKT